MKYVSADEAMKLVNSGDSVYFQGSTAVPIILQEALACRHGTAFSRYQSYATERSL